MQDGQIEIIVGQRGWVFVGKVTQDGCNVIIRDGFNVRRWGTAAGLGELAAKGPLKNTKLDATPEVRMHELAIVARLKCSAAWDDQCKAQ